MERGGVRTDFETVVDDHVTAAPKYCRRQGCDTPLAMKRSPTYP
jgi:hypothetical protein